MGINSSKTNKRYKNCELYKFTKHCCLEHCFFNIQDVAKLRHISTISWYFNEKHETALHAFLVKYTLEDITLTIMSYLENYKSIQNNCNEAINYRIFIRASLSVLNDDNNDICPIWLKHACRDQFGSNQIHCVLLGTHGIGKSSLIIKFVYDKFVEEYDPKIEDNFIKTFPLNVDRNDIDRYIPDSVNCKKMTNWHHIISNDDMESYKDNPMNLKYENRQSVTLNIFEQSSNDDTFLLQEHLIREGMIFLLVFDVTNQHSFDEIRLIRNTILRRKDPLWNQHHNDTNFAMIAVGTKSDLRDDNVSIVDMKKANEFFKETRIPYIETSAKNGRNVNFLFRHSVYEYWIQSHSGCMEYDIY